MNKLKIPVGRSGFADIRENGYYYIDKSGLIEELLKTDATQVTLITRPRRFGKTLAMNMLREFFDIQKDSRGIFAGLAISKNQELCRCWQNQYPTLFLSFRSVDALNFSGAYGMLAATIAELYEEHFYLQESDKLTSIKKDFFYRIAAQKGTLEDLKGSLKALTQMLAAHYGRPVILLLDEYDVPLAKASEKGYYPEMLDVLKGIMQVIKDNNSLKFAVITGCLRIAKESIFTGTNNFVSDTISDTRLNEYFGFTQAEVDQLLRDAALEKHGPGMKAWYDGYRFGGFNIYCPWDVMNHVNKLLLDSGAQPASYWKNSSDNAIIRSFLDIAGDTITQDFETLLSGMHIIREIKEDLTYDYLHSSEDNLWSILYFTGYLTRARDAAEAEQSLSPRCVALTIPNAEIQEIFEDTIKTWFADRAKWMDRKALFSAIWGGNAQKATEEITRLLRKTISYHDYREDFYHAFFAGIFAGAGYNVESNREHGEGRSDIVVKDYSGDRAAIFEVKYSKEQNDLEEDCKKALLQMDKRKYAAELEDDYAQIICYGISFFKKRCLLRLEEREV